MEEVEAESGEQKEIGFIEYLAVGSAYLIFILKEEERKLYNLLVYRSMETCKGQKSFKVNASNVLFLNLIDKYHNELINVTLKLFDSSYSLQFPPSYTVFEL